MRLDYNNKNFSPSIITEEAVAVPLLGNVSFGKDTGIGSSILTEEVSEAIAEEIFISGEAGEETGEHDLLTCLGMINYHS